MMYELLRNYRHARREYEHITGLAEQTAKGIQDFLGGDEVLLERLDESTLASRQRFYEIKDAIIVEFKEVVSKGKDTLIIGDILASGDIISVCVIRVYTDAIVIIEDNRRTVFHISEDEIRFYALDPQLEIYLEGGGLIADYDFCPF